MSLGDHMRLFDEEVDRLAEVAHRIDEELVRIEFNKPLRDRERPSLRQYYAIMRVSVLDHLVASDN
jgi:hypothetical protein